MQLRDIISGYQDPKVAHQAQTLKKWITLLHVGAHSPSHSGAALDEDEALCGFVKLMIQIDAFPKQIILRQLS